MRSVIRTIAALDRDEGFSPGRSWNYYWRKSIIVNKEGSSESLAVEAYFAERESHPPLPSRAYVDQIIHGAKHWELPADYIASLTKIPTAPPV